MYPWAKASAKPTYNFDEITNSPNKAYTGVLRRVIASGYELGYGYGSKAGFGLYQNHESFDSLMLSAWKTDDGSTEEDHWFNWYFDPIGQRITDDNGKTLAFTSEIPTSLPASDVYPWAKASTKPSYTPSEVGAAATSHKHAATDVTEDSTHRFMTDEERTKLKNLNNSGFEIKEIDNFNDASTSGIYAVRGNALGGPKYNDPSFAYRGCLKVFSQSSGSPSIPSLFTLMEFTVKDNNGNTFYFIRFYGEINNTSEDWVQVVPTSPSTSVPSPSPTD